jgi:hypothetical protein
VTNQEVFDLSFPNFETRSLLEEHDEFGDSIVTHRDREGEVVVFRSIDDVPNVTNVDSTLQTKLVRVSAHRIGEFSQSFSFVVCDTQDRLVEELHDDETRQDWPKQHKDQERLT